jgi:hypothetical protein
MQMQYLHLYGVAGFAAQERTLTAKHGHFWGLQNNG